MATNADTVVDDDKAVTEDDLRALKYDNEEVETTPAVEDETSEPEETTEEPQETGDQDDQIVEEATEETEDESPETPAFVKEFEYIKGDTPEEYARNLEQAYKNSTAEALRLKGLAEAQTSAPASETEEEAPDISNPTALYMKQKMDEEIRTAFDSFSKDYPQVADPTDYNRFTQEVSTLSQTILNSQGRLASPGELYQKAAVILGWEKQSAVDSKDKLSMALKDNAATSKPTSATAKAGPTKSKVTQEMIAVNRKMYPDKTDEEIRKELESYVT